MNRWVIFQDGSPATPDGWVLTLDGTFEAVVALRLSAATIRAEVFRSDAAAALVARKIRVAAWAVDCSFRLPGLARVRVLRAASVGL